MQGVEPRYHHRLEVLGPGELEAIHNATLEVLEKTGVLFESAESLRLLKGAGAWVEDSLVRFPSSLVERCLESAPEKVVLRARNAKHDVELSRGKVHYTNGYGASYVRDLDSGECRPGTLEDLGNFIRVCDALENVHYCIMQVLPQDLPVEEMEGRIAAAMLRNTEKHVHLHIESERHMDTVMALGDLASRERVGGDEGPVYALGLVPIAPLNYPHWAANRVFKVVGRNIPFFIVSGAMCGATVPATLAGTLVAQNAEVLAGFCLRQVSDPGAPTVYGTFAGAMDMSSGKFAFGGPEVALISAATQQLCEMYHVPFGYGSGGIADSSFTDVQAGFEKGLTALHGAAAGVDVIHDACSGLLSSANLTSYEQLIIDDEMCGMMNRLLAGIEVNRETLAVGLIHQVGPKGNYLAEDHTVSHFRKEHFLPKVMSRAAWDEDKPDIVEKAKRRARELLEQHHPTPLSKETEKQMERLLGG